MKKGPKLIRLFCCRQRDLVDAYEEGPSTLRILAIRGRLPIWVNSFILLLDFLSFALNVFRDPESNLYCTLLRVKFSIGSSACVWLS